MKRQDEKEVIVTL
jgi:calcium-dependent protein kinase